MPKQKHKVGVITAPSGIKGDVWVKSFTRPPEAIFLSEVLYDETLAQEFHLNFSYEKKGKMRCQLKQSVDRNQAENWAGTVLYKINEAIAERDESDNRPRSVQLCLMRKARIVANYWRLKISVPVICWKLKPLMARRFCSLSLLIMLHGILTIRKIIASKSLCAPMHKHFLTSKIVTLP